MHSLIASEKTTFSVLVSCLLLLMAPRASAHSPEEHEAITIFGVGAAFTTDTGTYVDFTPEVLMEIALANSAVDGCNILQDGTCAGLYLGTKMQHFDDNTIGSGAAFINNELNKLMTIVRQVQTGQFPDDMPKARRAFGVLLHTVQDFYSHSTWVDRFGTTDWIPWGAVAVDPAKSSLTAAILGGIGGSQTPCVAGRVSNPLAAGIVTEYFLAEAENAAIGNCVHGPSAALTCSELPFSINFINDYSLCYRLWHIYEPALDEPYFSGQTNGINKDRPGRRNFDNAEESARHATTRVAIDVLAAIAAVGDDVLCEFVGRRRSPCGDMLLSKYKYSGTIGGQPSSLVFYTEPEIIEITTTQTVNCTLCGGASTTVTKSSGTQSVGIRDWNDQSFSCGGGFRCNRYSPTVCEFEGEWVPKKFHSEKTIVTSWEPTCHGTSTQTRISDYELNSAGLVTVTQLSDNQDSHDCAIDGGGRGVSTSSSFSRADGSASHQTGAGSFSLSVLTESVNTFTYPGGNSNFSSDSMTITGSGALAAEPQMPPPLVKLGRLRLIATVPYKRGDPFPADCIDPDL